MSKSMMMVNAKTNSFLFKNQSHSPMDQPHHRHHHQSGGFVSRRGSRRSPHGADLFPTSPDVPPIGDAIYLAAHPQHPLSQTRLSDLFTCGACKEYGAGERFTCSECDYQLHDFCALAPDSLKRHPIHPLHNIILNRKPVRSGLLKSRCDICAKTTKGCVFKCNACSFQMHPCCAMLSTEINISVHPHMLRLLPSPSTADPFSFSCGECNRKRPGRVYHCTTCDYHLHAVCAKNMVNGLEANGIKGMAKSSKFGTAVRVASQVVIEFIGGLIEGLGEGVGQVLIQTAVRGRCNSNRSSRAT
ncbi:hypothetical protein E1A91_D11G375300v1 [Gossypium mustelinum]|uniref:DC1 domain-containing protein n=2 Tax=Gossypium mustelinum TaxID=34275 RepID=A0A5D2T2W2_GOSMU|nr:hypothetical protein E1A91_D11G375300v1 [Gossypium mustelinum]